MAQLNTTMILVDKFDENNFIKKEHGSFDFIVKPNEEVKWGILISSDVLFDLDEEVKDISVEFRMLYLGEDKKIKLEGNRLNFPIVEKSMAYTEITEPFSKKVFNKRTSVQVSTVFPGEGQYVLILLKNDGGEDKDINSNLLDLKLINVKYVAE